jgi:hypothetical protein
MPISIAIIEASLEYMVNYFMLGVDTARNENAENKKEYFSHGCE